MLTQEWREKGFVVTILPGENGPFYQLFHEDLFGLHMVAGSRNIEDMNGLAESVWNRMAQLRKFQEDDGEVE